MNPQNAPVVLVTGASSGIGEATARLFAEKGYRVALAARRLERLEALAEEIRAEGGPSTSLRAGEALAVRADVTSLEDIERMVAATLDAWGQIDVLVNNAGFGRLRWLEQLDPVKDIEAQLNVNLWGLIQTTRTVLPHMLERRTGYIINISSVAGWVALPTYSIYNATKFAVRGFTLALRRELRGTGVHVSGVYPGPVATEFGQHTGSQGTRRFRTPRLAVLSAEDVARAVWKLTRRPRRGVILPAYLAAAAWLEFLLPGLLDWFARRSFKRG